MKDIDIAKNILEDEELTMVVVKNGEIVFKSLDKGIKPMYILATEMYNIVSGASLADRVIGKGAALLCGHIKIKEVYTDLISESGIKILNNYNIPFTMGETCPYIKNRDKTGYCPIEIISRELNDPGLLLEKIKDFLVSINMI